MKRTHSDGDREFNAETLALGYAYDPELSQQAVKPPVFLTSTFQFASAAEGKGFFELAYGLRAAGPGESRGLIYSRLNNPNLQMYEERMAAWDRTAMGATFGTGMAAISTAVLTLVRPGDVLLSTSPVYGGTHYLFQHVLPAFGVEVRFVPAGDGCAAALRAAAAELGVQRVRALFVETPANPSLVHTDIAAVADVARELTAAQAAAHASGASSASGASGASSASGATGASGASHASAPSPAPRRVVTLVDNTLLGPVFQRPATLGADLVLYSATKFLGGHSDLVAGLLTGPEDLLRPIRDLRTILGTVTNPFNGWLLLRSLETCSVRMRRQSKSATKLAELLSHHPRVRRVLHPSLLTRGTEQQRLFARQCTGPGSLIAFDVDGGQDAAFAVLDRFEVFRLAVSLGGTESLVEHPMSMTHADVPPADLERLGVGPGMIRMSVGLEHLSDLKRDLLWALKA